MSYYDDMRNEEVLRVVKQIRKRAGFTDNELTPKLTASTIESEATPFPRFKVEVQSETPVVRSHYSNTGKPAEYARTQPSKSSAYLEELNFVQYRSTTNDDQRKPASASLSKPRNKSFRPQPRIEKPKHRGWRQAFQPQTSQAQRINKTQPQEPNHSPERQGQIETTQQQPRKTPTIDTAMETDDEDFESPSLYLSGSASTSDTPPSPRTPLSAQFFSFLCTPDFSCGPNNATTFHADATDNKNWHLLSPGNDDSSLYFFNGARCRDLGKSSEDDEDDDSLACTSLSAENADAPIGIVSTPSKASKRAIVSLRYAENAEKAYADDITWYSMSSRGSLNSLGRPSFLDNMIDKIWGQVEEADDDSLLNDTASMAGIAKLISPARQCDSQIAATNSRCGGNLDQIVESMVQWEELDTRESTLDARCSVLDDSSSTYSC